MDVKEENIQVIGCGFPRTGTASLKIALEILGFKRCHHMQSDVLSDTFPYRSGRRWLTVWDTEDKTERQALMRQILTGYKATVDFPPSMFVDDLVEMYPKAKVILGVRNPQKWRQSFDATLNLMRTPWWYWSTFLLPSQQLLVQPLNKRWEKTSVTRHNAAIYCTGSADAYLRHNDWVRAKVPEDRLLEFEASQGWEPLCEFLGVPIPEGVEFPHANDGKTLRGWFMQAAMVGWVSWILFGGVCAGIWQLIVVQGWGSRFLHREL